MSNIAWLLLGILIGWIVEWVIDWVYWRRKRETVVVEQRVVEMPVVNTSELDRLRHENEQLRLNLARYTGAPDDLKIIKGIGPEIERRLHAAGVITFAQLADLSHTDLEQIVGNMIKQLADEDYILDQARELARQKA